ncbi:MAG: prolyl oligopeptidase family serine peptidase [Sedimentisphaerales bacterium]|nr:prolyl oligopeptidase family serine peptidase [Sedimentisphaerales bacterium]
MGAERTAESGRQSEQTFQKEVTRTVSLRYLLYLPTRYGENREQKWPLILFLHGAGERGNDLELVKKHGPPKLIGQGTAFPFVIVSPQCPADLWWTEMLDGLVSLLDEVQSRYAVDPDRVYLTGLSMGGFGTWALGCRHPERFAAIAPICGGGEWFLANRLKTVPVWAFHGAKDQVVAPRESTEMVDALKRAGADVQLTVYPEAQHDSWTQTYNNPKLYEWFLGHRRNTGSR